MIQNWILGTDPEFFLVGNDGFVSSEGLIDGSKDEPRDIGQGCAVQEDCVAVEFNIPPVNNPDDFVKYIQYSMSELRNIIDSRLSFSFLPSAIFSEEYTSTEQGSNSGCKPDENVWSEFSRQANYEHTAIRAVGAHLHFGYKNPSDELSRRLVKFFEVYGTVATLKYEDKDAAVARRDLYGRAGSYRIKPYGVEYRSLSSFWLESEEMMRLIYSRVEKSIEKLNNDDGYLHAEINDDKDAIIAAIDYHDKMAVEYLTNKYKLAI